MATLAPRSYSPSAMHIPQENRSCGGCGKTVEVDAGSIVVAFGNSLWHVDCFKCAKCGDRVSADTNLLLLSDGSPVCTSCTYNCAVCKKPISDEAIMTGDESYHSTCFTCKTCNRHIGELVFARTTQGIYCMACHNERVARSRRHAELRRNKSKSRRDAHRDREKDRQPDNAQGWDNSSSTNDPTSPPDTPGVEITNADATVSYAAKRISTQSIAASLKNSLHPAKPLQRELLPPPPASPTFTPSLPSPPITTIPVPLELPSTVSRSGSPSAAREDTPPLLKEPEFLGLRRKSYDDGVHPLGGLLSPEAVSSLSRAPSTSAGTRSRSDKRSHINPAVILDWAAGTDTQIHYSPTTSSPATFSPTGGILSRQPSHQSFNNSRDSHERSPSPGSWGRQNIPRSSVDTHYSPPLSSYLNTSTEDLDVPRKETAAKSYTLEDRERVSLHHKSSNQRMVSGRASPAPPLQNRIVNGAVGVLRGPTPDRDLPKLPVEEEAVLDELAEGKEEEGTQALPLALPPISLSESDTNFNDLLQFGHSTQATFSDGFPENLREDAMHNDGLEASHSKTASPIAGASSPPKTESTSLPATKFSSSFQPPLRDLPKRSASLARKMSPRKPVPKAIVLPDSFDADMTLDFDESLNGHSSLNSVGHSEESKKASDRVTRVARRPASAGTGMSVPPSPNSKARRSSDNANSGSPLVVIETPTRSDRNPHVTIADTASHRTVRPVQATQDMADQVARRIKEALSDAQESKASTVRLDREFLEAIYLSVQASREQLQEMRNKFDRIRRTSQHFIEGLSVAQEEYDKELAARRDVEAEVTRLKVQLSGQAARLTQLSAEDRKRSIGEQMSRDMNANLDDLERDLSRIMAERDLAVAEVEELAASKLTQNHGDTGLQRSLTHRFETLKNKYKRELEPLSLQREALLREINELKEERNICLEETTALNARNEELAALNAQTARQIESTNNSAAMRTWSSMPAAIGAQQQQGPSTPKMSPMPHLHQANMYSGSVTSVSTSQDERDEPKSTPNEKKLKWFKPGREPMRPTNDTHVLPPDKEMLRHNFQQLTVLRVARCDYCGDKMWGTHVRCSLCNLSCHNRCVGHVNVMCSVDSRLRDDIINISPLQPSMFGRDLIEQVRADSVREHRDVPIIVEKCIEAVEILAMDYEGVYRKTGGSAQSKAIMQLFERGNYEAFDLSNSDIFNDVSSITSVLKTYFRQLPNPLLTNALHEAFVGAAGLRDPREKASSLSSLVYQLPSEHFHTLRYLMLHLYRVQKRSAENLMNARNLGVVFGPTLMRSSDSSREFADMAGKALAVEWLVENAPSVFHEDC